jgi:hypothetical protein
MNEPFDRLRAGSFDKLRGRLWGTNVFFPKLNLPAAYGT